MNTKLRSGIWLAVAAAAFGTTGQAALVSTTTLYNVLNGVDTLAYANNVWGDWSFSMQGHQLDTHQIELTASSTGPGVYRLSIGGQIVVPAGKGSDLGLGFSVTTSNVGAGFSNAQLSIQQDPALGGQVYSVDQAIQDAPGGGPQLPGWTRTMHVLAPSGVLDESTVHPVVDKVYVVGNIMIVGGAGGEARLRAIYASFQVPEPAQTGTAALLAMVGGIVFLRRRA